MSNIQFFLHHSQHSRVSSRLASAHQRIAEMWKKCCSFHTSGERERKRREPLPTTPTQNILSEWARTKWNEMEMRKGSAEWNGVRKESYLINKLLINVNRFRGGRTRAVFKCIAIWWWLQQSRHTARKEELMDARAVRWVQCVITWKASNNSWNCNYDAPQCARKDFSFHLNINTLHHHVCTKLHIPFFRRRARYDMHSSRTHDSVRDMILICNA